MLLATLLDPVIARDLVVTLAWATVLGGGLIAATLSALRLRRRGSAGLSHQLVLLALLSLVVLPLSVFGFVAAPEPGGPASHHAQFTFSAAGKFADLQAAPAPETAASVSALWSAVLLVWLVGSTALLLRLALRVIGMVRLFRQSRPMGKPWSWALRRACADLGVRGEVRLRTHPHVQSPMVWGPPRAFIVIPEAMAQRHPGAADARLTFLHELAHLQRRDSLWKLAAEVVCALHWVNPMAWVARRQLDLAQERAADSRVLQAGVRPSRYSSHLVSLVRERLARDVAVAGLSSMTGKGPLSNRLTSILDRDQNHAAPPRLLSTLIGSAFLLACTALLAAAQSGPQDRDSLHDTLNRVFVNKMADSYVAGAAISIVKDGELIYSRGFGRAEVFEPKAVSAEHTIFRIGSVTKVLTGIAVMQCAERGLLDLDADVNRYLKDFQVDDTYPEPVRVRHLLTHTAGFDQLGYGRHVMSRNQVLPLGTFLKDNLVRIRPPGEVSCYDTYAITLAGYLVEVVSGLAYEDFLHENIFAPLGMERSFITVPEDLRGDLAVGYEFAGEWAPQRWEYMNTDPASTANSTVTDMARLTTMFLEGGAYRGRRILSEASVQAMMTRQFTNHPDQPGYGLVLWEDPNYGVPAFSHGGSMTGFGCFLYLVPEQRLGLFVAYNQESGALADAVIRATVEQLAEPGDEPSLRDIVDGVDLDRFTGEYASNMYNHSRPERGGWRSRPFTLGKGERGSLEFQGRECYPVGPLTFQSDDGLLLSFLTGTDGQIAHLVVNQTVYEKR